MPTAVFALLGEQARPWRECAGLTEPRLELQRAAERDHVLPRRVGMPLAARAGRALSKAHLRRIPRPGSMRGSLDCNVVRLRPTRVAASRGPSDHPARFFENPRDVCPLDAVVNSAVDASGRAFCPELSCPSTHAARADGVRSGSAASSSRRMIEDIVALKRNARCPPRATSTFLRCAPWCVSNRHEDGGQKGSCRE